MWRYGVHTEYGSIYKVWSIRQHGVRRYGVHMEYRGIEYGVYSNMEYGGMEYTRSVEI